MGVRADLKWLASEGTGAGIQQRLVRLIMGRSRVCPPEGVGILYPFMESASAAVSKFGPAWARQEVRGKPVGVWLLLICWFVPPALLVFMAIL